MTSKNKIDEDVLKCKLCPLHKKMPSTPVPAIGNISATLMIVGEAPGYDESIQIEPFVGRCGKFLNNMFDKAGINKDDIFICNTVCCRPTNGNKDRPPSAEEISSCKKWLWGYIKLVNPRVIVTLGKTSSLTLGSKLFKKTVSLKSIIGKEYELDYMTNGCKLIPSYHPSYIMVHNRAAEDLAVATLKKAWLLSGKQ